MASHCPILFFYPLLAIFWSLYFAVHSHAADVSTFELYAYGPGIGGASVVYRDSLAFLQNITLNDTAYTNTYFTMEGSSSSTWIANPNTTASTNATWSDQVLYIPASGASTDQMGFASSNASNISTSAFKLYGQSVFVVNSSSGSWESKFYALPSSPSGIYSLLWDANDTDGTIPIGLRVAPPSN